MKFFVFTLAFFLVQTAAFAEEIYNPLKSSVSSMSVQEALQANDLKAAENLLSKHDALVLLDFRDLRDQFLKQTLIEVQKESVKLKLQHASRQDLCQQTQSGKVEKLLEKFEKNFLLGRRAGGLAEHAALTKFMSTFKPAEGQSSATDAFYSKRKWVVPKLVEVLEEYGHLLSFTNRKADAIQALQESIDIAPQRLSAHLRLAEAKVQCYFDMKDYLQDKENVRRVHGKICDLNPSQETATEINQIYPELCSGPWSKKSKEKIFEFAKSYQYKACTEAHCPANRCFELRPELFWYCSLNKDYDKGIAHFIEDLPTCKQALNTFETYATPSPGGRLILDAALLNCKNSSDLPSRVRKSAAKAEQRCLDKLPLEEKQGPLGEYKAAICGLSAYLNYYSQK
jgi:hypothetical protein